MRSLVAAVLLALGALTVPVATVAWWLQDTIVPTDGYVETVAPLATNTAVVAAVEARLVQQTMQQVDRVGDPSPRARQRITGLVQAVVVRVVEDPAFAEGWRAANKVAHAQVVSVLSGDSSAVSVRGGSTVEVEMDTLATTLRRELVAAGVPFARALPPVAATLPVGNVDDLVHARQTYSSLDRAGRWLPPAALLLVIAGVLLARGRARALGWTAFATLAGLGLLALGLVVARLVYLGSLPSGISDPAARAVFDTVTSDLRDLMTLVAAAALALLVVTSIVGRTSR